MTEGELKTPNLGSRQYAQFSPPVTPAAQQQKGSSLKPSDVTSPLLTSTQSLTQNSASLPSPITPSTHSIHESVPIGIPSNNSSKLQDELILSDLTVPSDFELRILQKIGFGSHANVYRCEISHSNNTEDLVIKVPLSKRQNNIAKREALILNKIHKSDSFSRSKFVNFFGVYQYRETLSILLEPMEIDLHSYLDSMPTTNETVLGERNWWRLLGDMIEGLKMLKELGIVHCDLKTSNVLMNPTSHTYKICDFTSSKYINDASLETDTTMQFMAPELLQASNKSNHNFETDLYSVGLISLHAATGKQPYNGYLHGSLIQLINMIKQNAVLKLLDSNSVQILRQNKDVSDVLEKIIIQRCNLNEIIDTIGSMLI